jgi:2-oxoglutarate dehydrogenase E2 component (dihydrolipoamide succinyltransferase)
MLSTPIINPPQSGILGMHNIVERPIVKGGEIVVAPIMFVALSYDHRIIDGRESVGFLVAVKEALENPIELLMNADVKSSLEL